jgi:hypothetical protein
MSSETLESRRQIFRLPTKGDEIQDVFEILLDGLDHATFLLQPICWKRMHGQLDGWQNNGVKIFFGFPSAVA